MTTPRVELSNIAVVRQQKTILDIAHLAISTGEILAVVGPNGAGKSTLVQVIGLLVRPDCGEVKIEGELIGRSRERAARRKLACVFQSPHLLNRTVLANVELGLRLRGVPRNSRKERVEHWLGALGLSHLAERRARTLSGGEAQRVNLARALALKPDILLLDEPLGSLDTPTRHAFIDELGPLVRNGAGAALLVTHDRRVALALGDRLAVMLEGRIRQIGPPEEVFTRPADEDIARFVGFENFLRGRASGTAIYLDAGPVLQGIPGVDGPVTVCLSAEDIHLGRAEALAESCGSSNRLPGKVLRLARYGVGFSCEVDVGFKLICRLSFTLREALDLAPGSSIVACIRPEALHRVAR